MVKSILNFVYFEQKGEEIQKFKSYKDFCIRYKKKEAGMKHFKVTFFSTPAKDGSD